MKSVILGGGVYRAIISVNNLPCRQSGRRRARGTYNFSILNPWIISVNYSIVPLKNHQISSKNHQIPPGRGALEHI